MFAVTILKQATSDCSAHSEMRISYFSWLSSEGKNSFSVKQNLTACLSLDFHPLYLISYKKGKNYSPDRQESGLEVHSCLSCSVSEPVVIYMLRLS